MRAVVYDWDGPPDVLRLEEVPTPTPGPGQVLVEVVATSVNLSDWESLVGSPFYARMGGLSKPRRQTLGSDIAGARFEDRVPLLDLAPEMMSVAFNAHDEHFQPDPEYPPNTIYSLHPIDELRDYARELPKHGVKPEIEVFHAGGVWNLNSSIRRVSSPSRCGRPCSPIGRAVHGPRPPRLHCYS